MYKDKTPQLNSAFDKSMKGFVFSLKKLSLLEKPELSEGLGFRFLCLQIYLANCREFKLEFGVRTEDNNQKRFLFSPVFKEVSDTFFHVKIPLQLPEKVWLTAFLDLEALSKTHCGSIFHGTGQLELSGNFRARKVFFAKESVAEVLDGKFVLNLPPQFSFPSELPNQFANIQVKFDKLKNATVEKVEEKTVRQPKNFESTKKVRSDSKQVDSEVKGRVSVCWLISDAEVDAAKSS